MIRFGASFAAIWACSVATTARADGLDDLRARGTLIWGADQEGGGPYVYPDPANADRVVGFEVDLAALLAAELGVRAEFKQCNWDTLPEFLENGSIDVVLNGYEWTPERATRLLATRPYYIYELQLLARQDDLRFRTVEDLDHPPAGSRYHVGVLGGSAAATYLREHFSNTVELFEYDGNTNAMAQVQSGLHDATLQDLPIAIFYRDRPQGRSLRFVGPAVGQGYYVMYLRKGENRLADALNVAIERLHKTGKLKGVYDRYELWNRSQDGLLDAAPRLTETAEMSFGQTIRRYGPILLKAAGVTVLLSVLSMPIAIVVGLFVALGRLYGPALFRPLLVVYVEVLRGTPLILQLYVIYFLLPKLLHIPLNPIAAAIAGLAINYSAYEAEIYRAGLQAIPRGQMEAALALGMSRVTALRRVIVPQAVRIVIPPVTNDFIALFKDTSVCSVIAVVELTKQYNMLANSTNAVLTVAAMTALLYLTMSYPLSWVVRRAERHLSIHGKPVAV
ncbi:MAG TPA: ABC transporter substrate-binding protein/permease [Phycisphaerae bacterium]|nr:ABC transporter substrate-binding protein/permease [Phycisphaerae bacterium]